MSLLPRSMPLLRASSRRLPALLTARLSSTASDAAAAPAASGANTASTSTAASSDAPLFSMENPYQEERRLCIACRHNIQFDYKNVRLLSQFVSPFTGRMYGRHVTGLCRQQHKKLDAEYKKAIACGYMGVMMKEVEFLRDPKICDPTNPVRPHRF
ncbi:28S ribosomal protein S18c, mitochondrial-like [Amphibalanus amphitrite]|uniref:28S ribosomal protein S18c, mitochondrial-like n=1 Tax=Amphibalanus amphitrite TaxID=1232801 RepID=UPI001C8FF08D|nr:28S ribosomal protein S18c, mitochondrial-like [Amphibalanus amphitrite]